SPNPTQTVPKTKGFGRSETVPETGERFRKRRNKRAFGNWRNRHQNWPAVNRRLAFVISEFQFTEPLKHFDNERPVARSARLASPSIDVPDSKTDPACSLGVAVNRRTRLENRSRGHSGLPGSGFTGIRPAPARRRRQSTYPTQKLARVRCHWYSTSAGSASSSIDVPDSKTDPAAIQACPGPALLVFDQRPLRVAVNGCARFKNRSRGHSRPARVRRH
ncbi:hypothetical protein B0H13DRAFT_2660796, partial [Mycena leptocephala]